jgi:hypothetical protein
MLHDIFYTFWCLDIGYRCVKLNHKPEFSFFERDDLIIGF